MLDGHLVEQNRKDALLHLAGILAAEDDHLLLSKVNGNRRRRRHALGPSVRRERTRVVNDIVRMEVLQLFALGPDKHVSHEQGMVGARTDDPHFDAVALIPAGEAIDNVNSVSCVQVVDCTFSVDPPDLRQGESSVR